MGKKGTCSTCRRIQAPENSGTRNIKGKTHFLANCRECDRVRMNNLNARKRSTEQLLEQFRTHQEMIVVINTELKRRADESA